MKLTSGFNFENYEITEYLGFCSGECVLGTGFFSSLDASISDLFGINSTSYSSKLKQAREAATNMLIQNAAALGADGIIGLDIDYTTFSSDIMGVIANGTAVKFEHKGKIAPSATKIEIVNYNPDLEFRIASLSLLSTLEKPAVSATVSGKSLEKISAVLADISFFTIFDEEYTVRHVGFANFQLTENFAATISALAPCNISEDVIPLIKYAKVFIRKYISDNTIVTASDKDCPWSLQTPDVSNDENNNTDFSNYSLSINEYMNSIYHMNSAGEILNYTNSISEENRDFITPELIQLIASCASVERMYGNCKNDCIEKIKAYFSI